MHTYSIFVLSRNMPCNKKRVLWQGGSPTSGSIFVQNDCFWKQASVADKHSNDAHKILETTTFWALACPKSLEIIAFWVEIEACGTLACAKSLEIEALQPQNPWKLKPVEPFKGPKNQRKLFVYKVFRWPFGSWTSAPKIVDVRTKNWVFLRPRDGEELFDPWASGRKGRERPQEIRTKKFMFMLLFFFPDFFGKGFGNWSTSTPCMHKLPRHYSIWGRCEPLRAQNLGVEECCSLACTTCWKLKHVHTGPNFIHAHPPTPEKTLLGVGGV